MAKVLVGAYTKGDIEYRKPPTGYDSCMNDIEDPSIFVIFDGKQIYPAYLIEYPCK